MIAAPAAEPLGNTDLWRTFENDRLALFRCIRHRCRNADVANDVVAETFLAALRSEAEWPSQAWLVTVARRRLVDFYRSEERQSRLFDRLVNEAPQSLSIDGEAGFEVHSALARLPLSQRRALELRYLEGHGVVDVAAALGVSYRAAESLLNRGRRNFARAYEEVQTELAAV